MNPRAQVARRVAFLTWLNFVLAAVAALLLLRTVQSQGERAPGGFMVGAPLFLVEVLVGLLPAALCVRQERLGGNAKRLLLVPAIAGPVMAASAAVVSLLTFGGC